MLRSRNCVEATGCRPRRAHWILVATALCVAAIPGIAQAQTPSLTGEALQGADVFTFPSGQVQVTANCDPSGTSTFEYTASGPASGPYPGTFTESGSGTIGPQDQPNGSGIVESFSATFSIESPLGQVTGTKSLGLGDPFGVGSFCETEPAGSPFTGLTLFLPSAAYDARIQTIDGRFIDRGETRVTIHKVCVARCADFFEETYTSQELLPAPAIKPGKGCGDKNHEHERENECKKQPK